MPTEIIEIDESPEYIGAELYAYQQRWVQACRAAMNTMGPIPDADRRLEDHKAYMRQVRRKAIAIIRRDI